MALNLTPLIRQLSIVDKNSVQQRYPIDFKPTVWERGGQPIDGDFGWAQRRLIAEMERQYNSGIPVRIIILKARQLGISTITSAAQFITAMMWENRNGLVITHENETTRNLFNKVKLYWDTWPWKQIYGDPKHSTQNRMVWHNGSSLRTATARNLGAGVGTTVQFLHTSECSRYPDPETLMGGLRQGLPNLHGTFEIVESTANGVGDWFNHEWNRSIEGESSYVPLFFPWFSHYEYQIPTRLNSPNDIDDEERRLRMLGASYEALEWRRQIIPDKLHYDEDLFRQEYPSTAEEAFLTTGNNIFDLSKLREAYVPPGTVLPNGTKVIAATGDLFSRDGKSPQWISSPEGKLTVFKRPSGTRDQKLYMVGVDPTKTTTGDPACIQVINRATHEQVAVWHGNKVANELARTAYLIARWYHDAEVIIDVGGGGQAVVALFINWGYPYLWEHRQADKPKKGTNNWKGFLANHDRKSWALESVKFLLAQGLLTIHDPVTFNQMQNYVTLGAWEMGPADPREHDDGVMAFTLAVFADMTETPYSTMIRSPFEADNTLDIYTVHGS